MSVIENPSINSVGQALGDLQTSVGSLCVSTHINKWAKSKPFRHASKFFATKEAMLAAAGDSLINYGIQAPNTVDSHPESVYGNDVSNKWEYLRPRGVVSGVTDEPYRIGDFRGYEHAVTAPVATNQSVISVNTFWRQGGVSCYFIATQTNTGIAISDLHTRDNQIAMGSFWLSITWVANNIRYIKSASANISSLGNTIDLSNCFDGTGEGVGNYNAVIMGAYINLSEGQTWPYLNKTQEGVGGFNGTFIALPTKDSDISKFATAIINVTASSGITSGTKYLATSPTASTWEDSETYRSIDTENYYTDSTGNGKIFVKTAITNNNSFAITINKNNLTIQASKSLNMNDWNSGTDSYLANLYDSSGTEQQSITIAAGATATIIVGYLSSGRGLLVMPKNSGGTIGQVSNKKIKLCTVSIKYNDKNLFSAMAFNIKSSNAE